MVYLSIPVLNLFQLGMDSAMATTIVKSLNNQLQLDLPLNACHIHIDLLDLTTAILHKLALVEPAPAVGLSPRAVPRISQQDREVVIVGQALRLPGGLDTPESFWKALVDRREDLMIPVPTDRWDHSSFYRPPASAQHKPCDIIFDKAGFIDLANFDNSFFGIAPTEAMSISPAVRLTLEVAFEALENANIPMSQIKGTDMGVYVATGTDVGYNQLLFLDQGYGGV